jgi:hypothetical protein
MVIVLIIAALLLIGVVLLLIKNSRGGKRVPAAPDRFKDLGPGEPKRKEPRAPGLD